VNDALQFDHAEYAGDQPLTCGACEHAITHVYHEMNGRIFCDRCRRSFEITLNRGSRFSRATRAIVAGTGAAISGALLYLAITQITGYELALVTIFIGYAVGLAVRWGSHGRGGWAYQALAIGLTYLAIVSSYVPPVVQGLQERAHKTAAATTPVTPAPLRAERPSLARFAAAVAVVSVIVFVAPFLMGFNNAIGLVIVTVGLYQAWKMNRRLVVNFSGPHRTRSVPAVAVPDAAAAAAV